jgi:ferredoxin
LEKIFQSKKREKSLGGNMDENIINAKNAIRKAQQDLQEAEAALDQAAQVQPAAPIQTQAPPVAQAQPVPVQEVPTTPAPEPVAQAPPPVQEQPTAAQVAAPATAGGWRVEYERDNCIGAGACVAANAEYWEIDADGKANLATAQFDQARNLWVLDLPEENVQKMRDAAGVCPVNVIHIFDPQGNKEI